MAGSLNDLMLAYYQSANTVPIQSGTTTQMSVVSASPGFEDSVRLFGSVSAPAANANIVSSSALSAGLYLVRIKIWITGTTVAAVESTNCRFKINAVSTSSNDTLFAEVPSTAGSTGIATHEFLKTAAANDVFRVMASAASTAGSVYNATLHLTRVAI